MSDSSGIMSGSSGIMSNSTKGDIKARLLEVVNDDKYGSYGTAYLREHKEDLDSLAGRRTRHGGSLLDQIISDIEIPGRLGLFATDADSYECFSDLFRYVIGCHIGRDLDPAKVAIRHVVGDQVDLKVSDACRDRIISSRCRFARNIRDFAFPSLISNQERLHVEGQVKRALAMLPGDLAGTYTSLADIPPAKQEDMIRRHQLFHNHDCFLVAGGFFGDWPVGRGVFMSRDQTVMVWVGEEDHIRCMSLMTGSDLSSCYNKATRMLEHLDNQLGLAHDERYGWLTSCPTNVGTGMRASVHIALPRLLAHRGLEDIKALARSLNLDIRGVDGENTEMTGDVVDVSNRYRSGVTQHDAISGVINGLKKLVELEGSLPELST